MKNSPGYFERQKALLHGRSTYSTGIPCKHGHISERFTRNRACIACYKEFLKRKNSSRESIGHVANDRCKRPRMPDGVIPGARVFVDGKQVA